MIQFQVKDEVKQQLKHSVSQVDLVIISIDDTDASLLTWTKPNKEFRFQGQMYDVVDKEVKGTKTFYRCLHDFKESKLFAHLDMHIKNYIAHNPEQQNKAKNFFKVMAKLFFLQWENPSLEAESIIKVNQTLYIQNYKSIALDLRNPPPQNSLSFSVL